jgi:hypothetical protein
MDAEARDCGLINGGVIPAKVGIQAIGQGLEMPACAGMIALDTASYGEFN